MRLRINKVNKLSAVVQSSNVKRVTYYTDRKVLSILYNNGGLYHYSDVPLSLYVKLLTTKSKGKFVNKFVKPKFKFRKVL